MENNSRKNMIFRITLRFATVFFAVLAFLTYFSSTINRSMLPTVQTAKINSGTFSQNISGTAMLNKDENSSNMYFTFDITKAQRKYFAEDTLIEVSFDAFDELHKTYKNKSEMTPYSKIEYNKDKDNYTVTANMPDCRLEVGEVMPSVYDDIFYNISVSSDYYDIIVPQSAVADNCIYILYKSKGSDTAIVEKLDVDILATDDLYYAIRADIFDKSASVVTSATKDIKSGDTVIVKGSENDE